MNTYLESGTDNNSLLRGFLRQFPAPTFHHDLRRFWMMIMVKYSIPKKFTPMGIGYSCDFAIGAV